MTLRHIVRTGCAIIVSILIAASPAQATFHFMQIEQIIGGVNGDDAAQAIQLRMRSFGQNMLAGARMRAFDAAGQNPIVIIDFTNSVPGNGAGDRVLIASAAFSAQTTPAAVSDFTMAATIPASYLAAGSVTFENNAGTTVYWRVSWGGASYTGPTNGAITNDDDGQFGPAFDGPLPADCARGLQFQGSFSAESTNNAADYALTVGAATFINNSGASFTVNTLPGACCGDTECDDGVDCTADGCNSGTCESVVDNGNCPDDGQFCSGPPTCDALNGCVAVSPCGAGQSCDEAGDTCFDDPIEILLEPVVTGLASPVDLTHAGDGSGRLFIVDQAGLIRVVDAGGSLLPTPFLDLTASLPELGELFDERGVLGLAFHPNYANNGRFFVRYSVPRAGDPAEVCNDPKGFIVGCHSERLSEFAVSPDPNVADPASETVLFEVEQPQFNHDAGAVHFGPDGLLYFTLGDGGGANDGLADVPVTHGPDGNGLNPQTHLGSMLRIDVDSPPDTGLAYAIPGDNPFADGVDGQPEIYAYGMRNPFNFSFDDEPGGDGALYVADVGQALVEEINIVQNGGNYGWVTREGTLCFDPLAPDTPPASCSDTGLLGEPLLDPVSQYFHPIACIVDADCAFLGVGCGPDDLCENEGGISVIGGFVYRGAGIPDLVGKYVYGDFAAAFFDPSGRLYYFDTAGPNAFERVQFGLAPNDDPLGLFLKGFGRDEAGELYVLASTDLGPNGTSGVVLRMTQPCSSLADCADGDDNGLRDDTCLWYDCVAGQCQETTRTAGQADIGGANGDCLIEGACDGNDRFHALNCFANQDTLGNPGAYPCETAPPGALNVDAGGANGACALDGVCDGNDAFAALNCFSDTDTTGAGTYPCICSGPAPAVPAQRLAARDAVGLVLAAPRRVRPGSHLRVDVYLDTALNDLRGYQLHLGVRGGRQGGLELMDISIDPGQPGFALADQPYWFAFNVRSEQLVVGLDGAGVPTPNAAYLATLTYRVSPDAVGTFEIDVRYDGRSARPKDRTFLFGSAARPIDVAGTKPARITVRAPAVNRNVGRASR